MTLPQQRGSLTPRLSRDSWGWVVLAVRDRDCGATCTAGHIYGGLAQSGGRGGGQAGCPHSLPLSSPPRGEMAHMSAWPLWCHELRSEGGAGGG